MTEYISRYMTRTMVLLAVLVISGSVLFRTSQSVQQSEEDLAKIERKIAAEKERLAVLEAEWAYLNTPYRLEMLAHEYLGLGGGAPENIVPYQDVDFKTYAAPDDAPPAPRPVVFLPRPKAKPAAPRGIPKKAAPLPSPVKKEAPVAQSNDIDDLLGRLTKTDGGA